MNITELSARIDAMSFEQRGAHVGDLLERWSRLMVARVPLIEQRDAIADKLQAIDDEVSALQTELGLITSPGATARAVPLPIG